MRFESSVTTHSPWGENSPALVTMAESALERQLSQALMKGGSKPRIRRVAGVTPSSIRTRRTTISLFFSTECSPWKVDGGIRTSTLSALTPARVAVVSPGQIDRAALAGISQQHRREEV